jgi:hypothetical protein
MSSVTLAMGELTNVKGLSGGSVQLMLNLVMLGNAVVVLLVPMLMISAAKNN